MSRFQTIAAAGVGISLVALAAALATGTIGFLWNAEAIAIVLGGSILAAIAGSSPSQLASAVRMLRVIASQPPDGLSIARWWITTNIAWRRDGIQALQHVAVSSPCKEACTIIQFCADGFDPDEIARLSEQYLATNAVRYERAITFFRRLAGYAPTMGIIGTVIGLASALGASGDSPALLLQRIGFAFSATLWGLVTANFLWLPIAQRLESALDEQRRIDTLHIEAARLVASGSTPLLTRYRLATLLPEHLQKQLLTEESA